jgi:hypothetical protein
MLLAASLRMATIERGEFTLAMLGEYRSIAATHADRGESHIALGLRSVAVHILKSLGRVREALLEGTALFPEAERAFRSMTSTRQENVVVGLRATIGAAIASPEVPVVAVEQSIVALEQLCADAQRPAGAAALLRLQLRATLEPTTDLTAEVARLRHTVEASSQLLLCTACLSIRLGWYQRAQLSPADRTKLASTRVNCIAERAAHLLAEHSLAAGDLVEAERQYKVAVANLPASVLSVPLVRTGLAIAAASGGRRKVAARLRQLDAALADYEYPYEAFEAVLLVERLRRAGLTPRKLPARVEHARREAAELAALLDARSPRTNAMKRLTEAR